MSTALAFNPISDLAGNQTEDGEVTLVWTPATPIYVFVNGDAETDDMTGWTSTLGGHTTRNTSPVNGSVVTPPQGAFFFDGGSGFASSKSHQRFCPLAEGLTIDQIDNDALNIVVDWWGGQYIQTPGDQPQLNILFYDESNVLLSTYNSGYKSPSTATPPYRWSEYQETVEIPVGTRFIDIQMESKRNASGGQVNNDGCFDDIRYSLEDAVSLPFVPGYAVYQDGVLIDTADANSSEFVVSGLAPGTYEFKIVAYDGANFLSADSNTIEVEITPDTNPDVENVIFGFDDEEVFVGYLGGKLRGRVVACKGRNANTARKC